MGFQAGLIEGGVVGRTVGNKGGLVRGMRTRRLAFKKEGSPLVRAFEAKFGLPFASWTDDQINQARPTFERLAARWGVDLDSI